MNEWQLKPGVKVTVGGNPVLNGLVGYLEKELDNGQWIVRVDEDQIMDTAARDRCEITKYYVTVFADKLKLKLESVAQGSLINILHEGI